MADPRADATLREDAREVLARLGADGGPAVGAMGLLPRIEDVIDEIVRRAYC